MRIVENRKELEPNLKAAQGEALNSFGDDSMAVSLIKSETIKTTLPKAKELRRFADKIIMWLINVTWSIPTLLLVIAITLALGKGFWQVFIAVGLTMC